MCLFQFPPEPSSTILQYTSIWTEHGVPLVRAAQPSDTDPPWPPAYTTLADIQSGSVPASPHHVLVPDPGAFTTGSLHWALPFWRRILHTHPDRQRMLRWLQQGVRLTDFALAQPISGTFSHPHYGNASTPPPSSFRNRIPPVWRRWVDNTLDNYLTTGAIRKSATRPHNISTLTIEPSKPRLCFDGRFINLFAKHVPFSMQKRGAHRPAMPLEQPTSHVRSQISVSPRSHPPRRADLLRFRVAWLILRLLCATLWLEGERLHLSGFSPQQWQSMWSRSTGFLSRSSTTTAGTQDG